MALLLALQPAVSVPAAAIEERGTTDGPKVVEVAQTYHLSDENGESEDEEQTSRISVQAVEITSPQDAAAAQTWFKNEQKLASESVGQPAAQAAGDNGGLPDHIALVAETEGANSSPAQPGMEPVSATADLEGFTKVPFSPSRLRRLARWVRGHRSDGGEGARQTAPVEDVAKRIDVLADKLDAKTVTLAVVRFFVVGGATYTGFIYSNLPLRESIVAGITIGLLSGGLQLRVNSYTNLITRKGRILNASAAVAAHIASVFGFDYSETKKALVHAMPFDYTFNQSAKLMGIAFLAFVVVNLEFFAGGAPLHTSIGDALTSIVITAASNVIGQGTMETAIATHKREQKAKLLQSIGDATDDANDNQAAIQARLKKLEVTTAVKIFALALVANFATVLVSINNSSTAYLGQDILSGLTAAGVAYWAYLLHAYNEKVREKVTKGLSTCQSWLYLGQRFE